MSTQVDAMIEESGLDAFESDELAAFLAMVGSLVDDGAPTPSPALAKLLSGAAAGAGPISLAVRRHQNALAAAVLAVTGIVATEVAAAANDLPPPAQRIVADLSNRFLPFDFPYPGTRAENLTEQSDHTLGESHDPDRTGGTGEGVDDGEASTGRDGDDDSGASPESQSDEDESGTQTSSGEGDDPEDAGSGDSGESSSGETDGQDTTAGDDASDVEEFEDDSADMSGESGGDDPEHEDDTRDSSEAIDD